MNKQSRLDLLENLSLLGSGVGAMASIALNQASFAIAPLSLSLALGVLNRSSDRRKLQENQATIHALDQRLSQQFTRLQHQVSSLPTADTIHQLSKGVVLRNRELAENLYAEMASVQEEFQQRFERLEQEDLNMICHSFHQLSETCSQLSETVIQLQEGLQQVADSTRIEQVEAIINHFNLEIGDLQTRLETLSNQTKPSLSTLQERVNRLDRLLSLLPPPVDVTSLKTEVAELIRVIGDLVPKRDVLALTNAVNDLQRQQDTLQQSMMAIESSTPKTQPLQAQIEHLETVVQQLSHATPSSHASPSLDMVAVQRQLNDLAKQVATVNQPSIAAHLHHLDRQFHHLRDRVQSLSQFKTDLIFDFEQSSPAPFPETNASQRVKPYAGSRAVLLEALKTTQHRLILICPWSAQCPLDDDLMQAFENFLSHNRYLAIGWCHIAPRETERLLKKMRRGWRSQPKLSPNSLQQILRKLLHLKQTYPDRFEFKVLGTQENFLVSDHAFAVLDMADTFQTHTVLNQVSVKLRTREPHVIQQLIQRFEQPTLSPEDLNSYWNRAVTRQDLGDVIGAIEDYTYLSHQAPDALLYNYRGIAHYETGNIDAAIADFTASLQLTPHQFAAHCNLGFLQAELGNYQQAIHDYSTAIQTQSVAKAQHPQTYQPQSNLAIAYFCRGNIWQRLAHHQNAISDYTAAIEHFPDTAAAYFHRSQVWQILERYELAIEDLVQAVDRFTALGSTVNAQKVQNHLTQLRQLVAARSTPAHSTHFTDESLEANSEGASAHLCYANRNRYLNGSTASEG
jgi:tetratricopeptide (TPR) repeat protein